MKYNIVAGLGEIGVPISQLLRKNFPTVGYDIDPKRIKRGDKPDSVECSFLHICIPFSTTFGKDIRTLVKRFSPECVVIHSTVSPQTTRQLQSSMKIPLVYSSTTGVHRRMLYDIKRYTKFFAIEKNAPRREWAAIAYRRIMRKCGIKTKRMSTPVTLELAKILCDTSYYGWLINYAQLTNLVARKFSVDYDEMWQYAAPIQKFLENRPKMFPGYIGGHCVISNLELVDNKELQQIKKINDEYLRHIPNARAINKKYEGNIKRSRNS